MFVDSPPKKHVKIEMFEVGPAILHNIICWMCDKNPAVYSVNPEWVFKPCWKCQKLIGMLPKKKWWQFWR